MIQYRLVLYDTYCFMSNLQDSILVYDKVLYLAIQYDNVLLATIR